MRCAFRMNTTHQAPTPTLPPILRLIRYHALAWPLRGVWLGVLAFAVSLSGFLLLSMDESRNWGVLLIVLSAILAVGAWGSQRWLPPFPFASASTGETLLPEALSRSPKRYSSSFLWKLVISFVGVDVSAMLVWLADSRLNSVQFEIFGLTGWLWLLSIAILIASTALWPRSPVASGSEVALPEPLEVTTIDNPGSMIARWAAWEIVLFIGLVALSLLLRLWDLAAKPYAIHGDEILTGWYATPYAFAGGPSVFSTVWYGINLPALWFWMVGQSLHLAGFTLGALRLPAALFGALTIVPFYALVRGSWGRAAAIGGSSVLAFSAVDIHFSRVTLNNITTQFFWAACFFFLLRALRTRRPSDWAFAGLAGGLSEHFYYGTRLLWMVLLAFAAYLLIVHRRQAWRMLGGFALTALGYIVGFGPLMAYYLVRPDLYFGRGASVLTWSRIPQSWDDMVLMWNTLWPIMSQNLLGFTVLPANDSFYFAPLLFAPEAALLVLGVGLLVWRWRHPAAFLMLLSGLGVLFVGGTLVPSADNFNHWTPAFPAFYCAIAIPLGAWIASVRANALSGGGAKHNRTRLYWLGIGTVAVGLASLGYTNVDYYFNRYVTTRPEAEVVTAQSRAEAALGPNYAVRNVGRTWQLYDPGMSQYLVTGQDGAQIFNPASELPLPGLQGKGAGFFFFYKGASEYSLPTKLFYPGAVESLISTQNGQEPLFDTLTVSPQHAADAYGSYLQVFNATGRLQWQGRVPFVGSIPSAKYPATLRWSGGVYLAAPGGYRIQLDGAVGDLLVDGVPADNGGYLERSFQAGWHRYLATVHLDAPSAPKLIVFPPDSDDISRPGGVGGEPAQDALAPMKPGSGLLGAVAGSSDSIIPRVDPYIGFAAAGLPTVIGPGLGAVLPVRSRWIGDLLAPTDGMYSLEVRTDGQASLAVDGIQVLVACSSMEVGSIVSLPLTAGWHPIQFDYVALPGNVYLNLWWTLPTGARAIVPPDALRHFDSNLVAPKLPQLPIPPQAINCAP